MASRNSSVAARRMSAIDGESPPMNGLPSRKNARYTSSGSASAFSASCCACAFIASSAADVPTSPGYCGNPSAGYVARVTSG